MDFIVAVVRCISDLFLVDRIEVYLRFFKLTKSTSELVALNFSDCQWKVIDSIG